jgi:hypothetical protein
MRKKDNDFEHARRRERRIADDAALALRVFDAYRRIATSLHMEAELHGIKDVKFMGTQRGVLVAEARPGALRLAVARCDWPGGKALRDMIETEGYSKSPEVLAMIPNQPIVRGAFIERMVEKECRDLLVRAERRVSLFSGHHVDDDGRVWTWPFWPFPEEQSRPPDTFDEYDEDLHADGGFAGEATDLLAGGGFHVTK